nr:LRR receptor-like serine/threonine-protein kinase RCH1 [Ipomoea batatas]
MPMQMPMPMQIMRQFLNPSSTHNPIFIFLTSTLLLSCASSSADNINEALVLFSWLHQSPSPPPAISDWNPKDPNPCHWSYIFCSPDNLVTAIFVNSIQLTIPFPANLSSLKSLERLVLSGVNLTGTIPLDIGDCISLKTIDLSSNSLVGSIPRTIGKLTNLQNLILNSNYLTGEIPAELGNCINLQNLYIYDNELSGKIPVELGKLAGLEVIRAGGNKEITGKIPDEIGDCQSLRVLGLADTKVSGSLPATLGKLANLKVLSVYTTMVSGKIPAEIGNCSELVDLYLYENDLSGSLPAELGKLQKLEKALLWQNNLVGGVPEEIGNCKSLIILDLSLNFISGSIPWSFGNLTNLQELMLSNNNFSGSIPPVLSNATKLMELQVDTNQISGTIPPELGLLTDLTVFFAWQNRLEGNIPPELASCRSLQALDLSHNSLNGSLPSGLFELKNLTKFLLISNYISGSIPPEIGNCSSLIRLRLVGNKISGDIPAEIGFLDNLSFLDISDNLLTGSVPDEIGNCRELQLLNLANNTLTGTLPESLSSLRKLQILDFSVNNFSGQIPSSYGLLSSLNRLLLGGNSFVGSIPSGLGNCSSLELLDLSSNELSGSIPVELFDIQALDIALNLSWNALVGTIPSQISALKRLSVLDLSHNKLGGDLMPLSGLENLVSLNVSYNNFTGYLPDSKLFRQLSAREIAGNPGLCSRGRESCFLTNAGVQGMRNGGRNLARSWRLELAIALLSVLAISLAILGIIAVYRLRKMSKEGTDSELGGGSSSAWQFIPFQKLHFTVDDVLKCLVESNVIGKGCSGVVYRAELSNGEVIAVKKLWPRTQASGYANQFGISAYIRDSFSTEVNTLGSIRHKNIVRFLGCCRNQNTRDIKANNILVGLDFEPYIADFGLAKLVSDGDFARSSSTVAGSYGYIAPEYGYMMKITEKSDVYSYGVVVLEVLTGKQPIDPTIPDGAHIVDWVRQKRGGVEVLDGSLRARPESEIEEMMQTLGVAVLCVNPSPDDRPTMKDVAAMLKEIRQEREEALKFEDMLRKGSSEGDQNKSCGPSEKMQSLYLQSNNTSFSASSLLHSSSSNTTRLGFK